MRDRAVLDAAVAGVADRSGVRLHIANGRFSVTTPASSGGSFRRYFAGEAVEGPETVELRGEFATEDVGAAFFVAMSLCLALASTAVFVAGVAHLVLGDAGEGRALLLQSLVVAAFTGVLAVAYRTGAYAGLASQDLIHDELVRLQRIGEGPEPLR